MTTENNVMAMNRVIGVIAQRECIPSAEVPQSKTFDGLIAGLESFYAFGKDFVTERENYEKILSDKMFIDWLLGQADKTEVSPMLSKLSCIRDRASLEKVFFREDVLKALFYDFKLEKSEEAYALELSDLPVDLLETLGEKLFAMQQLKATKFIMELCAKMARVHARETLTANK